MPTTTQFIVTGETGIHCESCERRIATALKRLLGVEQVEASATTQGVTVVYDPAQVSQELLLAKLEQAGFTAAPSGGAA